MLNQPPASPHTEHRVGAWSSSPTDYSIQATRFSNQTLRVIVRPGIAGRQVWIRISNLFGRQPLVIGEVHLALAEGEALIRSKTDRVFTFAGLKSVTIPAGSEIESDPLLFEVMPLETLAVSIYFPEAIKVVTGNGGTARAFISSRGNLAGAPNMVNRSFSAVRALPWVPFLTGLDVLASESTAAIVAFGDSLTVGPWPDYLLERLVGSGNKLPPRSVLRQGISGNRILHNSSAQIGPVFGLAGITRFERDALEQAGVKYIVVFEGINDLVHPGAVAPAEEEVSAAQIVAGLQTYIKHAHQRGLKIIGATLAPFGGYANGFTAEREARREEVNRWIRGSGAFDGFIDPDKALRDPAQPVRLLPLYDEGDHLHINDVGAKALADSINLSLFRDELG